MGKWEGLEEKKKKNASIISMNAVIPTGKY